MFQFQVHGNDLTSLCEQVPKEVLPTDYGGKAGSVAEHWGEIKYYVITEMLNYYCMLISIRITNAP